MTRYHRIQPGDRLSSIAHAYGIAPRALLDANKHKPRTLLGSGIEVFASLAAGEELIIPTLGHAGLDIAAVGRGGGGGSRGGGGGGGSRGGGMAHSGGVFRGGSMAHSGSRGGGKGGFMGPSGGKGGAGAGGGKGGAGARAGGGKGGGKGFGKGGGKGGGGHHHHHHGHHNHWHGGWGGPFYGGWGGWGWFGWPWYAAWGAPYWFDGCTSGYQAVDYLVNKWGLEPWWVDAKIEDDGSISVLASNDSWRNARPILPSSVCGYNVVVTVVGDMPQGVSGALGEQQSCPGGYWDNDAQVCVAFEQPATIPQQGQGDPLPAMATCPSGTNYVAWSGLCADPSGGAPVAPSCGPQGGGGFPYAWDASSQTCIPSNAGLPPGGTSPAALPPNAQCASGFTYMSDGSCQDPTGNTPPLQPTCTMTLPNTQGGGTSTVLGTWNTTTLSCVAPTGLIGPPPPPPPIALPAGASCPAGASYNGQQCVSISPGLTGVITHTDPSCASGAWDSTTSSCIEETKKGSVVPWLVGGSIVLVAVGLVYATLSIKPPPKLRTA